MHEMNIIIVSATSDIGFELALKWAKQGNNVVGTYRTKNDKVDSLNHSNVRMYKCDLSNSNSIEIFTANIQKWDVLVICPGTMEPVGGFDGVVFSDWKKSIGVNFISQLETLHRLLPKRSSNLKHGPVVIFFAGGGTNSAPVNYSAYTVSKIALIKMTELLDAEIPDTRFSIIGPGWVDTKIHQETLKAGAKAGNSYQQTIQKLKISDDMTPMAKIYDCCNWIINSPRDIISGRNFSVVHDEWGQKNLDDQLKDDANMYKLRRHSN